MGNKGKGSKTNVKTQAKRAEESGEDGGVVSGGGGGGNDLLLRIALVRLDLGTVSQAIGSKGDSVEIQWEGVRYEVYWSGHRLGSIPSNYNDQLSSSSSHIGQIVGIDNTPQVVISVTVKR